MANINGTNVNDSLSGERNPQLQAFGAVLSSNTPYKTT